MRLFVAVFPPPAAIDHLAATVASLPLKRRIVAPRFWHLTLAFLGEVPLIALPPSQTAAREADLATSVPVVDPAGEADRAASAPTIDPAREADLATSAPAADPAGEAGLAASVPVVDPAGEADRATSAPTADPAGEAGKAVAAQGVAAQTVWRALGNVRVPVGELSLTGGGRFGQVVWAGVGGDLGGLTRLSRAVRRELRGVRVPSDDKRFRPHLTVARSAQGLAAADMERLKVYQGPSWPVTELVLVRSELGPHPAYHRLGAWPVASAPRDRRS